MDLLKGNIRQIYFKYLAAAFGSALITSIYSIVDMAMVGKYQGPDGTATLAIVAPIWNLIYSLGLLMGIGGSVLYSARKGSGKSQDGSENQYFTASLIGSILLALLAWLVLIFFERPLLSFFGGSGDILDLAIEYVRPIKVIFPAFLFNQMLAAWLRNDNDPALATAAVLSGGIFNIFGDYFFVFTCDMGIYGAGLATAVGSVISLVLMLVHFFKKINTLSLPKPEGLLVKLRQIIVTGFSTFFIDAAMGILTILFNRQIMKYLGSDALSIYGTIINVSTFVQCCAYSVGQASQPLISTNYGAGNGDRIRQTLQLALETAAVFGIFWTVLSMLVPNLYIRIFMTPTAHILSIAPGIIRKYSVSFLLLPFNIFSTYYFQSIMKPKVSFTISVFRGLIISGILIMILPMIQPDAIWFTMPVTELLIMMYAGITMKKATDALPGKALNLKQKEA